MSMSVALVKKEASMRGYLPWTVLGLGLALVAVNLAILLRGRAAPDEGEKPKPAAAALPSAVTLPEGKLKAANLGFDKVELVSLPTELGVPGRIDANQDRQVQVRPRATGVVREVKVALGQDVKKGQTLAVLDSPDVGSARLNLRAKQRELATARIEADWKNEVAATVAVLIPELRKKLDEQHQAKPGVGSHSPSAELERESELMEKQYADRKLGTFRATLMSAAVEFDIAAHEEQKTSGLHAASIVGEHPKFVAQHNREIAESKLRAVLEQAKFDAPQQDRLAQQAVKLAESNVIDAAQRLMILGVSEDVDALLARAGDVSAARPADEDVTAYPITAPFDCTVISRSPLAVPSQKIEMNDSLFGLADLSTVWVMANIPESDFPVLPALREGTIRLYATAYPGRTLEARVLSVGATVDSTTRTVPMLAETANKAGLLKIGMFVRIVLDTSNETKALTVPASAVVEIEGKKGVFSPDPKDRNGHTFDFRHVKLGREAGGRVEVTSGLSRGDSVVSRGADLLKGELILQNESEEE
jgi:RND family efflux transporter MFP subunit